MLCLGGCRVTDLQPLAHIFDDATLSDAARWHSGAAATWKPESRLRSQHERFSAAIEDGVRAHRALSERFVNQTAELHIARYELDQLHATPPAELSPCQREAFERIKEIRAVVRPGFQTASIDLDVLDALLARSLTSDSRTQNE